MLFNFILNTSKIVQILVNLKIQHYMRNLKFSKCFNIVYEYKTHSN